MAVLKWSDVKPEDLTSPKMLDVKMFCHWMMYVSEAMQECWARAPETKREDVAAAIEGVRFKMHGWKLQLNQEGGDYVLYRAKGDVRRPPRFQALPPSDDEPPADGGRSAASAAPAADVPEAPINDADCPQAEKKIAREAVRNHIVELCKMPNLPQCAEAARHNVAVILSRLRASAARVKAQSAIHLTQITKQMALYRKRGAAFVQHQKLVGEIRHFLTRFREPAFHLGTTGARLQPVWLGYLGMDLIVRSWEEIAPQIIDWDSYLFGEMPPEESELATG